MFLRRRLVFRVRGRRRGVDSAKKHHKQQKYSLIKKYKNVFKASFGLLFRGLQRGVDSATKSSQTTEVFFDKIVKKCF